MRPEIQQTFNTLTKEIDNQPPVLEIGGFDVNGSVKPYFKPPYLVTDMREAPNVDEILDITKDITKFKEKHGQFNTIVCCETLEHVSKPWVAAENIYELLAPQGLLFVSVPFKHQFHAYPNDYYRYTPEGLEVIFERLEKERVVLLGDKNFPDTVIMVFRKVD